MLLFTVIFLIIFYNRMNPPFPTSFVFLLNMVFKMMASVISKSYSVFLDLFHVYKRHIHDKEKILKCLKGNYSRPEGGRDKKGLIS